jgi:hypothetical protein
VKKEKQLDERICVLFLLNLKSKFVYLILAQILRWLPFLATWATKRSMNLDDKMQKGQSY